MQPDLAGLRNAVRFGEFGRPGRRAAFTRVPFDTPLFVMYSSGTTGVPKCIVHGVGGTLLQHRKEHLLHTDLKPDDRLFFFTTCGWMMWNWLVSGLATGCTLVLYEGSPFAPDRDVLWRMAERERVTHFGTSPKYLSALQKDGGAPGRDVRPRARCARCCPPARRSRPSSSTTCTTPIKARPAPGLDLGRHRHHLLLLPRQPVAAGAPRRDPVARARHGDRGLRRRRPRRCAASRASSSAARPFPSMPIGFWNDPDGAKYRAAYFERFPDVWCHGDYAVHTEHGGFVILGRSDAVLNPGGVRIGTAEIYRQVEKLEEILESLAVGQDWDNDVRVVLFVRLRPGVELDAALEKRIRDTIRASTTPRHVPARIVAVPDIPRTISGKIVELAVRNVIHGRPVRNTDALANPQALEHFRDRPELAS